VVIVLWPTGAESDWHERYSLLQKKNVLWKRPMSIHLKTIARTHSVRQILTESSSPILFTLFHKPMRQHNCRFPLLQKNSMNVCVLYCVWSHHTSHSKTLAWSLHILQDTNYNWNPGCGKVNYWNCRLHTRYRQGKHTRNTEARSRSVVTLPLAKYFDYTNYPPANLVKIQ
jgi:hypothetical protein